MSVILSVLALMAMLLIGASLLTLVGIVLSLGYYDKEEVRQRFERKRDEAPDWFESTNLG